MHRGPIDLSTNREVTRRGVLRMFALSASIAGGAALLAACGGAAPAAAPTTAAAPTGAAAAPTTAAAGAPAATTAPSTAPTTAASGAAASASPVAAAGSVSGTLVWLVRSTPEENNGQAKIFEPAIKAKYPNLTINRIIIPQAQYVAKINSMAAAKEQLDIWGFGGNYMDYWARKMPEPLNQYIQADKWDIDSYFLPGLPEIFQVHGHYYGLCQQPTYGSCLVYNKKLFDAAGVKYPPVSWDDTSWTYEVALDNAHKMTKNWGKPDGVYGMYFSLDGLTDLAWLQGTDNYLKQQYQEGIAPKTQFNNDGNIAGHQLQHDWIYKEQVHPDPSIQTSMTQNGLLEPLKTGTVAMEMSGGWLYWTLSDLTAFPFGYAAFPTFKTNKNHNYDDFWIMGNWASNKDVAWQVLRVITDVQPVTDYSKLSGAPPAVRAATDPWLQQVSQHTGQSVEDLRTVTSGAIVTSRSQESEDHLFLQYAKIADTYTNSIQPLWADANKTAAQMIPQVTQTLDQIVGGIYNQFKDSIPTD